MKKILIPAFFVGMILLSYTATKALIYMNMNDVEEHFRTYEYELSNNEVLTENYKRSEGNKFPTDRADIIRTYELKETRVKNGLGWDLTVDTLKQYFVTKTYN